MPAAAECKEASKGKGRARPLPLETLSLWGVAIIKSRLLRCFAPQKVGAARYAATIYKVPEGAFGGTDSRASVSTGSE